MRVLFIFKDSAVEHLGAMYISSMLKENGHRVEVVNAEYIAIAKKLREDIPTILAYSTLAFYANYYIALNKCIKEKFNVFSLFGGAHPTAKPEIIGEEGIDAVCIGEGEYPLLNLANTLEAGGDIRELDNLWIKDNGKIIKNRLRPLINNLDELPFPDRGLFKQKSPFFQERISMITSRGCTYSCPYCYNSTMLRLYKDRQNTYRRRGVDNVIEEVRQVKKSQSVKFILFHDDIFILDPAWLEEFAFKYKQEGAVPFSCYVRIGHITPEIVSYLKYAGCHSVSFGVESGNDFLRKDIYKRNMEKQEIIHAAKLIKSQGLKIRTTNIIGYSSYSIDADLETLRLNIQCGVDLAKVGLLATYPNTEISAMNEEGEGWARFLEVRSPRLIQMLQFFSSNMIGRYERFIASFVSHRGRSTSAHERETLINLYLLFPLVVGFPFLFYFIRKLIKLPIRMVLVYLNFFWDNYCTYFRIYPTGWLHFFSQLIRYKKISKMECK